MFRPQTSIARTALLASVAATSVAHAQFSQAWVTRHNGAASGEDDASVVAIDRFGDVCVAGSSASASSADFLTIKYAPGGAPLWTAAYNGPAGGIDAVSAVATGPGGEVYVTGWSAAANGLSDFATIKYDPNGVQQWVARYDGPGAQWDDPFAIALDAAGNVYVAGASVSAAGDAEITTVKYSPAGAQLAVIRFSPGAGVGSEPRALALDAAGNIYVCGWRYLSSDVTGSSADFVTIKYNAAGVQLWAATYAGPGSSADVALAMQIDASGNVYVTGSSMGTSEDYATIKYSSAGAQLWVARYDGPAGGADAPAALALDGAGNVLVCGTSAGVGTGRDLATLKYDASGATLWTARYDGAGNADDEAAALAVDASGVACVAGRSGLTPSSSDYVTLRYSSSGAQLSAFTYNGPGGLSDQAAALAVTAGGKAYAAGQSWDSSYDCATVKYSAPNQAPTAVADSYPATQGTPLVVAAPGVLANDSDPDSDGLRVQLWSVPGNGAIDIARDGSFTYTPNASFVGTDQFSYLAGDGEAGSAVVTVTLTVAAAGTVRLIANSAPNDGYLAVRTDAYGSIQTLVDPNGNEDRFNPPGLFGTGQPTFASGLFLFVGTSQRELLSDSAAWQNTDLMQTPPNPANHFSADASLSRSVTQCCTLSDTNGDSVNDTVESAFAVTGAGVNLEFELTQHVSPANAAGAAYLRQDYVVSNQGAAGTFRFVYTLDADLTWTGAPYYSDDWVGVDRSSGVWYAYVREPSDARLAVTLSSLNAWPVAYCAGKTGIDPDGPGGSPPFAFGTSADYWNAYGIPAGWRNFAAGVGYDTPGVSGSQPAGSSDPYDAFVALEFVLTLGAGEQQTLTLVRSYGTTQPLLLPPPCPGDGDGDRDVDQDDLDLVLFNFDTPQPPATNGDADGDGDVDQDDLDLVLFYFGASC